MRDLNNMMCLGIYLEEVAETKRKSMLLQLKTPKILIHPLKCWDLASYGILRKSTAFDILQFQKLAARYRWDIDLTAIYEKTFDAMVVTDMHQKITWVSHGFKSMTGYSPAYALRKKPSFLQGKNTNQETKKRIREAIHCQEHIETTLINYRRDGSEYNCRIEIIPLSVRSKKPTHFLAIEQAI